MSNAHPRFLFPLVLLAIPSCSLITVPVKTVGSLAETTVSTAGGVVEAPFKAAGGAWAHHAPESATKEEAKGKKKKQK
jgi:hypothetical protein